VLGLILGALGQFGILQLQGLTIITGMVAGVAAVGAHTLATKMGGK
jgi:hypothetical protein